MSNEQKTDKFSFAHWVARMDATVSATTKLTGDLLDAVNHIPLHKLGMKASDLKMYLEQYFDLAFVLKTCVDGCYSFNFEALELYQDGSDEDASLKDKITAVKQYRSAVFVATVLTMEELVRFSEDSSQDPQHFLNSSVDSLYSLFRSASHY